ncbi:hypothetical protein ACFXTO_044935 [Malus domestica]
MHIAGRGKKGFMIGSIKKPNEDSAEYDAWETGNAIIYELKVKSFRLHQEGRPIYTMPILKLYGKNSIREYQSRWRVLLT